MSVEHGTMWYVEATINDSPYKLYVQTLFLSDVIKRLDENFGGEILIMKTENIGMAMLVIS
jgi:hypothetical protein